MHYFSKKNTNIECQRCRLLQLIALRYQHKHELNIILDKNALAQWTEISCTLGANSCKILASQRRKKHLVKKQFPNIAGCEKLSR